MSRGLGDVYKRQELAASVAADAVVFVDVDNSAKFAFAEISLKRGTVFSATALRRSEGNNIHSRHYSTPELEMEI